MTAIRSFLALAIVGLISTTALADSWRPESLNIGTRQMNAAWVRVADQTVVANEAKPGDACKACCGDNCKACCGDNCADCCAKKADAKTACEACCKGDCKACCGDKCADCCGKKKAAEGDKKGCCDKKA